MPENGPIPKPDVLIVARGGGSLEDLWPFNEEVVIRAVYTSEIPLISAVGHETDTMLIDYVSDMRAPTPTGAAEFAVPVRAELLMQTENLQNRLKNGMFRFLQENKNKVDGLARGIPKLSQILLEQQQRLDDRFERLKNAFRQMAEGKKSQVAQAALRPYYILNIFEKKQENLKNLAVRLEAVSIESVLRRGFVWVQDSRRKTVYSAEQARKAAGLEINFADGKVKTKVVVDKNELQMDLFG